MAALDIARGAYARLPPATRSRVGRFLRYVPTSLKFGKTYRAWRDTIDRAKADVAFTAAFRQQALGDVVDLALRKSAYYQRAIGPLVGDLPRDQLIGSEAWTRIPVLSRQTIIDHRDEMCTISPEQLDQVSTDGSSGEPLNFLIDRDRSPKEYAFIHNAWSRTGFKGDDWRCVFRGLDLRSGENSYMEAEEALKELRFSVFHLNDDIMPLYLEEIRKRNIQFIHGYPSAIAIFSEFILRKKLGPVSQIRGIFPISEKIYPHQRELMAKAFDRATLVPFYGLSEKVAFAQERAGKPDEYEFDPIYGYTELVDDDGYPVTIPGETGRIVSTSLLFKGMPLIRYDTRDTAELVEMPATHNGYRLVLRNISPRRDSEYVIGKSGALIPFCGLCVPIDAKGEVREVLFIQDTPGEVELQVVTDGAKEPDLRDYLDRMAERSSGDLNIKCRVVDSLPISKRGKRKFIDQRLDLRLPY